MSGFDTSVMQIPLFVVPPSSSAITINFTAGTGVTLGTAAVTSGMSWSGTTLTISTSFEGSGWVSLPYTSTQSLAFGVVQSDASSTSTTATSVTVSSNGSLSVTTGTGVSYQAVSALVTDVASNGQVAVYGPLFFVPTGASSNDLFQLTLTTGSGISSFTTPTLTGGLTWSSSSNTINVPSNLVTATAQINFNLSAGGTGNALLTILPSVTTNTNGTTTDVTVNSNGQFIVTDLGNNVKFTGANLSYDTNSSGTVNFDITCYGTSLNSNALSWQGGQPTWISNVNQSGNTVSFRDSNSGSAEASFTIGTAAGTVPDPTIMNNPDRQD